jgi:hypothetical protein
MPVIGFQNTIYFSETLHSSKHNVIERMSMKKKISKPGKVQLISQNKVSSYRN